MVAELTALRDQIDEVDKALLELPALLIDSGCWRCGRLRTVFFSLHRGAGQHQGDQQERRDRAHRDSL